MNAVVNPSAAPSGSSPAAAPSGESAAPWYQGDAFKNLPPDAAGWLAKYKSSADAIVGGWNAAKRLGVPADRLVALPEKPDDPAWRDVRARIGWAAPEKPEDYGLAVPEGQPAEFAKEIANAAHELGVPKPVLEKLAAVNAAHMEAQQQRITSIVEEAEAEYTRSLGPNGAETLELTMRGLQSAGIGPEVVEAAITAAALHGGKDGVRGLMQHFAAVGQYRREAPFHDGAPTAFGGGPDAAKSRLQQLSSDREWSQRALTRGTPEAVERMRLVAQAQGVVVSEAQLADLASGIARGR